MQVAQYTFQSPSSSQVQIGRLDPSSKEDVTDQSASAQSTSSTNETLQDDKSFETTPVLEVNPAVKSEQLLDLYA